MFERRKKKKCEAKFMDDLERNGNVAHIDTPDLANESEPPSLPSAPPPGSEKSKAFAADLPRGSDALGIEAALRPLAELAVHRDTEAPLTIALLGPSGSGKSFALAKLLAEIESLSATGADGNPFLARVAALKIDVAGFDDEPGVALARVLYERLEAVFPEFVREVAHAVRDPQIVAREAAERLDETRRRLDTERQKLEEIESRRALLPETVLFESAASPVDAYARANRTRLESRLDGFGITGDPIANYKSLVRDVAGAGGPLARAAAALRAFWAFKGQTRLLIGAAIFVLIGLGLDATVAQQASWLGWLRSPTQGLAKLANLIEPHIGWLTLTAKLAYAGAALALLANLLRGARLLRPLFRGVSLLEKDVADRRRTLDSLYAHQMRRVDGLEAELELAARRAAEADRRAGTPVRSEAQVEPSPFADTTLKAQANRFFAALGAFMDGVRRSGAGLTGVPQRLVVALDDVDALPQAKVRPLLEAAHRAFANAGIVTLIAADRARIEADNAALEKWIQVPFHIGAGSLDHKAYIAQLAGRERTENSPRAETRSIDWSISADELGLLGALAPLAGGSPRAVKRFVNLYRVARAQAPDNRGALALLLALELGGTDIEITALRDALTAGEPDADLEFPQSTPRLFAALQTVDAQGRVSVEAARRAAAIAEKYSFRA